MRQKKRNIKKNKKIYLQSYSLLIKSVLSIFIIIITIVISDGIRKKSVIDLMPNKTKAKSALSTKPVKTKPVKTKPVKTKPVKTKPVLTYKQEIMEQLVPFKTDYRQDPNLPKGTNKVVQNGVNGLKKITQKITFSNNQQIKKEKVKEEVITHVKNKIVVFGTKNIPKTIEETTSLSQKTNDNYDYQQAKMVLHYVNIERKNHNLPALTWSDSLSSYARIRAKEITQKFDHVRPNNQKYYSLNTNLINGENLVAGTPTPINAQQAVAKWMASSPHKKNILEPRFKSMGVGYLIDDSQKYKNYWAQLFSVR